MILVMYDKSVRLFSKVHDFFKLGSVSPSNDLVSSIDYLGKSKSFAEKIVKASRIIFFSLSLFGFFLLFFFGFSLVNLIIILVIGLLINHLFSDFYKNKSYEKRVKDLSKLPDFFSLLISNLKINPNLERSLDYVSKYSFGKVTDDVGRLVRRMYTGKEYDIKKSFLNIMKGFNNKSVFNAANTLIGSLSIRNKNKRNELLERSLSILLKGVVEDARKYSNNIYLPVLLIFSFGTIIPLIIISVFPVISFFTSSALNINNITIIFSISLIVNYFLINRLKNRSPPSFSQINIEKDAKGISLLLLFVLFVGVSSPSFIFFFSKIFDFSFVLFKGFRTLFLYLGVSLVLGLFFYSKSCKLIKVKKRLKNFESGLITSFYSLGSKISEGQSVEKSIEWVGSVVESDDVKSFYKKTCLLINRGVGLKKIFSEIHVMDGLSSHRIKGLSDLFVTSVMKHSRSAGENIVSICDFYSRIRSVEKELNNVMSKNAEMIKLTGLFFTPFICALVINIQELLNESLSSNVSGFLSMNFTSFNNEYALLIISFYVLGLSFLLSKLYSFIINSGEEVSSRYYNSVFFFISCLVFTATLIITRLIL